MENLDHIYLTVFVTRYGILHIIIISIIIIIIITNMFDIFFGILFIIKTV